MSHRHLALVLALAMAAAAPRAQALSTPRVTTPFQAFGHNLGDDYFLASYRQIAAYWHTLDAESDRMPQLRQFAENGGTIAVAAGMKTDTDFFFDNSPVWTLGADAASRGVKAIAWFDSKTPLRSGWAWGQAYLDGGVIAAEARIGKGRALLFAAEILQRGQPHATFKMLFNGIYSK